MNQFKLEYNRCMRIKPLHIALVGNYLSDLTLVAWVYYHSTQLSKFNEVAKKAIDSPDFQLQMYKVFLQSLTFFLILFFMTQTFIYLFTFKKYKSVYLYLKYFSVTGFAIYFFIAVIASGYALVPMCLYVFGYYHFSKQVKAIQIYKQMKLRSSI